MWFLAILLGTLVVVCSGVVSYRLKDSINNSMPVEVSVHTVTSGVLGPDGRDDPALTAYRRLDQLRPGDETTTSEGRRTR